MPPLTGQRLRRLPPRQGVQVPSLLRKLRYHMAPGQKNQKIKQKQYCNKINKDFKNDPNIKKKKESMLFAPASQEL